MRIFVSLKQYLLPKARPAGNELSLRQWRFIHTTIPQKPTPTNHKDVVSHDRNPGVTPSPPIPQERHISHTINLTQLTLSKHEDAIPKARELEPFVYADQAEVIIDLWSETSGKQVGLMPLGYALMHHIKPGIMLVPRSRRQQPINKQNKPPVYILKNLDITVLESMDVKIARQKRVAKKQEKQSRRFIFGVWGYRNQNLDHYMRTMNQSWHYLLAGYRVEIHLQNKLKDQTTFKDRLSMYLHLRPDVILKSMPLHSSVVIQPQTDHKTCCWTMDGPYRTRNGQIESPYDQTYKLDRKRVEMKKAVSDSEGMLSKNGIKNLGDGQIVAEDLP